MAALRLSKPEAILPKKFSKQHGTCDYVLHAMVEIKETQR